MKFVERLRYKIEEAQPGTLWNFLWEWRRWWIFRPRRVPCDRCGKQFWVGGEFAVRHSEHTCSEWCYLSDLTRDDADALEDMGATIIRGSTSEMQSCDSEDCN